MKRLSATLAALTMAVAASAAPAQSVKWRKAFPAALAEAKKAGKLVMIDFYTDW